MFTQAFGKLCRQITVCDQCTKLWQTNLTAVSVTRKNKVGSATSKLINYAQVRGMRDTEN
jgi:hypothetical protein